MKRILFAAGVLALTSMSLGGCKKDQFKGAEAEVGKEKIDPDMPATPAFDLPPPNADGSHTVKELRVQGRKYFGQEITVKGYVTWIYDCATELRGDGLGDADVKKVLEESPERCKRPQFRIGDTADAGEDRTIKVVEVPRAPTKQEAKVLKDEIKDPTIWRPVPPLKLGDEVVVKGDFTQKAPHGDSNMDGLLVYKTLQNVTTPWSTDEALAKLQKK